MNVNIKWLGKQKFEATSLDGEKVTISPNKNDLGTISPPDLLLMSLGSCTGLFLTPAAKSLNVDFKDFEISLEGTKSDTPPKLFDKIQVRIRFKGLSDRAKAEELVEAANARCFILHSLNPNIEIENIIEFI